jgi:hypothetical protein
MHWLNESFAVKWYRSRSWLGRRVVLVALALLIAWVLTAAIVYFLFKFDIATSHEVIIGALVAWTGELIFFSVLGGIISVVTLKDPAQAPFDERIKILFGTDRLPDPVMTYNKRMVSRLAGFAQTGDREVILDEYRADLKAYRARIKTTYIYRNLLPDVDYDETLPWHYRPDVIQADPPIELARILSIEIDGTEYVAEPIPVKADGFHTELRLKMPRKGQSRVVFSYTSWIAVGELQTMNPRRLVEQFTMSIVNQCTAKPARMAVPQKDDAILLLFNQKFAFDPVQSVAPDEQIFTYSLLPPQ